MKDFLGNQLEIGDTVVLTAPRYRHFTKATVIKFTPQNVRVEYINTWNFSSLKETYLADPKFLIKIKDKG